MHTSNSSTQKLFEIRNYRLSDYRDCMYGYRSDTQALLYASADQYPVRPAIHLFIANLYQTMLEKVGINEAERSAAEKIYSNAKKRVTAYVQTKIDHTGTREKLKSWDVWTKMIDENSDRATVEKLLKASDHVEDTLFLAEMSCELGLPSDKTHVHKEITALVEKLDEYIALIPPEKAQLLQAKFLPSIPIIDKLYMERNYAKELETIKANLKFIR